MLGNQLGDVYTFVHHKLIHALLGPPSKTIRKLRFADPQLALSHILDPTLRIAINEGQHISQYGWANHVECG